MFGQKIEVNVSEPLTADDIRITGNNQIPASTDSKKRSRNTYRYIMSEFSQSAAHTLEPTQDKLDRNLPAPPARPILNKAIGSCLAYFLDFSEISKNVQESREALLESICGLGDENQRNACAESMAQFESRMIEDFSEVAEQEINTSYDNLRYLLSTPPFAQSIPWQSRLLAVSHFLVHAAKPESACQGSKIGSEVLCLIQRLFATRPSRVTEMIASAAILGEWQTFDGKTMIIDEQSLKPGPEEILYRSGENKRSYAVKLMQLLLLNNVLRRRRQSLTYAECPGRPGKKYSGQIVRNQHGDLVNPKLATLSYLELALLAKFEFNENSCVIVNTNAFPPNSPEYDDYLSKANLLVHISSPEQLSEALQAAKKCSAIPITIAVDERRLLAESYQDGINHCINVVQFNEFGLLRIYNPQLLPGMQRSSKISLQRLYNATLNPMRTAPH